MLASALCLIHALPASGAQRSQEIGLLRALETASLLVIGRVGEVTALPHVGYAARFSVERVLRTDGDASQMTGQQIELAWEEPSRGIQPRLSAGQRVVMALEAAPTASIWKQRIPNPERRAALHAIAARGQGYLQGASFATLGALEHYLALTGAARRGEAGANQLSHLAARAPVRLALDAVERLRSQSELIAALTPPAGQALIAALLRVDAEAVTTATLRLIEAERPSVLLSLLDAKIGGMGIEAPWRLLAARAALQEGIPEELAKQLLESGTEEQRVTATRWAAGPRAGERLRSLMLGDRSAAVREAALLRLAGTEGAASSSDILQGLEDSEPSVRYAAARTLAAFGVEVLPDLRRTIDRGSPEASKMAVLAISLMTGSEARNALEQLAVEHADKVVRAIARVSLGRPLDEAH